MVSNADVLILCGGKGERLRSVIGESQKVMAEINGHPFLTLIVGYLKKQGFRRLILCVGYKGESVEDYFRKNRFGLDIHFSVEKEPLGTGGALAHAIDLVRSDIFFVLNGDSFSAINFKAFLDFHKSKEADATIAISKVENTQDYGQITLGEDQRILQFQEKTPHAETSFVNAGIYCFNKTLKDVFFEPSSLEKDIFPKLTQKKLFGYIIDQHFVDIGTPDRYIDAQKSLKKGA